jgi:hypothetical protein
LLKLPEHKASLHITHNQHKDYYETVESYTGNFGSDRESWVSDEQKKKSLETQELWELQWYPLTPVGSYCLWGADLDVLIEEAFKIEKRDNERQI